MKTSRLAITAAMLSAPFAASPAFAGDVNGFVVDASGTAALQAAEVRIVELNRSASTERDGSFLFADVPAGDYTIEARYVGAPTVRRTVNVPATGTARVSLALGGDGNEILVIGQYANQASALSRKKAADGVSDVLTRDAIGQFPDQNVSESLRRLPGINVLNDQGEGRFVSVRGLAPELNATSLNGVRLPSPEADVRAVALDVISSDIVESIEVKKSLTPDMDADTIGASIEIETTSAFDRQKDLLSVRIEGSYNDKANDLSPKGGIDFAARLTDNIGVSGGASYYIRRLESDNIEAENYDIEDGVFFPEDIEYRDIDVERERISANLGFDFKLSDTTELYIKGVYSQFDDQEYRRRLVFGFEAAPSSGSDTSATFSTADLDVDEEEVITVERDIKDRFETQKIRSVVIGGETDTGDWFANYSASWAKSTERENGSIDPATFAREFEFGDDLNVTLDRSGDPRVPIYSVSGSGAADFFDAGEYELDELEYTALSDSEDEEYSARIDLGRRFFSDAGEFTVQAGFKGRWRDKRFNGTIELYENDALTLADFPGRPTYELTDLGTLPGFTRLTEFFDSNRDDFELDEAGSLFSSAAEDFRVKEDILAGYLLARFDSAQWRIIGGVRYEHTSNELFGNDVLLVEEEGTLPGGGIADEDTVIVSPIMLERNYDTWLPSLNIRYEAQSNLVLRAAGYRSIIRPTPFELAPHFAIEEADDGEREGEFGNPNLRPTDAWNFDVSAEWYMSSNGAITIAGFYKELDDFIATVKFDEPDTFRGFLFDEAEIPMNGDSAEIWGVEIGFSQAFTFLPAPFDGLLFQANYTYTDAEGIITTLASEGPRSIPLPGAAKHTGNIVLGYEKGPVSLRLAGTYRDSYLDPGELGEEAELDRYVDDHFQLDLSAKYQASPNIQFFYEWVNINDAKYFAYNNFGGRRNVYQYDQFSWTMKFGTRVTF